MRHTSATAVAAVLVSIAPAAGQAPIRAVAVSAQLAPGAAGTSFYSFQPPVMAGSQVAFDANLTGAYVNNTNDRGFWVGDVGSVTLRAREGDPAPGIGGQVFATFNRAYYARNGLFAVRGVTDTGVDGIWTEVPLSPLSLVARDGDPAPGMAPGVTLRIASPTQCTLAGSGALFFTSEVVGPGVNSTNNFGAWIGEPGNVSLVARRGDQVPGLGAGVRWLSMDAHPTTTPSYSVGFSSSMTGSGVYAYNDSSIWVQGPLGLRRVVREGEAAPGMPAGAQFDDRGLYTFTPATNSDGHVSFVAHVVGGGVTYDDDSGLWLETPDCLALAAREGQQAPGVPAGAIFGSFEMSEWDLPRFNDAHQVAFHQDLGGAVGYINDHGIWMGDEDGLSLVTREGDPAPGTSPGVVFYCQNGFQMDPVLNDAGQVAFLVGLRGGGVNNTNDVGIWATDPYGVLTLVAREGMLCQVAPGQFRTIAELALATNLPAEQVEGGSLSVTGELAFWARFTDGSSAILVATVPEPTSAALLASLAAALGLPRRRNLARARNTAFRTPQ